MADNKPRRILTIREGYPADSYEAIEVVTVDGKELFNWRLVEAAIEGCFPVCMEFVEKKFQENGRTYRRSGLEKYLTPGSLLHG